MSSLHSPVDSIFFFFFLPRLLYVIAYNTEQHIIILYVPSQDVGHACFQNSLAMSRQAQTCGRWQVHAGVHVGGTAYMQAFPMLLTLQSGGSGV